MKSQGGLAHRSGIWLVGLLGASVLSLSCGPITDRALDPSSSTSTAPANSAEVIRLGHYGSMSGENASYGVSTDKGIRLAVEQRNAAGGSRGRRIEVVTSDDQSSLERVVQSVLGLIQNSKVHVVLGEVASSLSLQGAPICQDQRVPMITPSSVAEKITQQGDYIFRTCFTASYQGRAAAVFSRSGLKARRAAMLVGQGSDYSIGCARAFEAAFRQLGGQIVESRSYSGTDKSFQAQLTSIRDQHPDVIYVPADYGDVPEIARQARGLGINTPLIGGDGWDSSVVLEQGKEFVEGYYFITHYAPDQPSEQVKSFIATFRAKYGETPDAMAALGYDAARVAVDAIERGGSTDPAQIRQALAATRDFAGVTGRITMGPDRNPRKAAMVVQIRDNAFRLFQTLEPEAIGSNDDPTPASVAGADAPPFAFSLASLGQHVTTGLSQGAIYGLIAVGYTIVFGILRLINFAHGDIFMLGPVLLIILVSLLGGSLFGLASGPASAVLVFGMAVLLCGAAGFMLEKVAYRPLRRPYGWSTIVGAPLALFVVFGIGSMVCGTDRPELAALSRFAAAASLLYGLALALNRWASAMGLEPPGRLAALITAIAVSLFLEYLAQNPALFGNRPRGFPAELVSTALGGRTPLTLGAVVLDRADVLVFGLTFVLMIALHLVIKHTRIGQAMRAVSDNPGSAVLMGIDPDRVVSFCFALGGALAGVAGVLWAVKYPTIDPFMGIMPGLKAFVAAVLGGIGSVPGAALGGLLLGVVEALSAASPISAFKDALVFLLLIAILLARPSGLLGRPWKEKV